MAKQMAIPALGGMTRIGIIAWKSSLNTQARYATELCVHGFQTSISATCTAKLVKLLSKVQPPLPGFPRLLA